MEIQFGAILRTKHGMHGFAASMTYSVDGKPYTIELKTDDEAATFYGQGHPWHLSPQDSDDLLRLMASIGQDYVRRQIEQGTEISKELFVSQKDIDKQRTALEK